MCCHIACGTLIEVGRRCCWERLKKKEKYLKVTKEFKKREGSFMVLSELLSGETCKEMTSSIES